MTEKEKILAGEVSALLAEAERIDKAEDAQFGKNRRGDELPAEAAREQAERRSRERGDDDDTTAAKGQAAVEAATPKPKAQRNFTDPDLKIMLTGDGAFHQCYNAQAVVDADHQVIAAKTARPHRNQRTGSPDRQLTPAQPSRWRHPVEIPRTRIDSAPRSSQPRKKRSGRRLDDPAPRRAVTDPRS